MFPAKSRSRRAGKRRRLGLQNLESRRLLAVSVGWDGAGLGSAELTYTIANSPDSLSQAETTAALETALAVWSEVVDITFTETDQTGLRDSLDFSFTSIDGTGGTLAQAYFPDDINPARIAGDVQFDLADAWEVGNSLGNQAFDLVYVAVHEIGHALGLEHSDVGESVLAPYVSASQSFEGLDDDDVAAILGLYAPAVVTDASDDDLDSDPVDETPSDTDEEMSSDTGGTDITAVRQRRFDARDADEDGLLTEDEVRDRFWTRLAEADTDGDGGVSFEQFETFLDAQETGRFVGRLMRHHHGHHATDQVFAAIGRRR